MLSDCVQNKYFNMFKTWILLGEKKSKLNFTIAQISYLLTLLYDWVLFIKNKYFKCSKPGMLPVNCQNRVPGGWKNFPLFYLS